MVPAMRVILYLFFFFFLTSFSPSCCDIHTNLLEGWGDGVRGVWCGTVAESGAAQR